MTLSEIITADLSRYELKVDHLEVTTAFANTSGVYCDIRLLYTGSFDENDEKEIKKIRSRLTRVKPLVLEDFDFFRKSTDHWSFHGILLTWSYILREQ